MKPVISHISALEYWRSTRGEKKIYRPVKSPRSALKVPPTLDEIDDELASRFKLPIHVLVDSRNTCRRSDIITSHAWQGSIPRNAILDTGEGFYVCCPEMTLVLMGQTLEKVKLIKLGYEFCGTYNLAPETSFQCEPLTSVRKLKSFIDRAEGMYGRKNASAAMRYIEDNSASIRETHLVLLLCLPYSLGGYGFEFPKLNYRIELDDKTAALAGKSYYNCDLYWPSYKFAAEYDSDQHHGGFDKLTRDAIRRLMLEKKGIKVITVTNNQLKSKFEFEGAVEIIASHLGRRLRYKDPEFSDRCYSLREKLF